MAQLPIIKVGRRKVKFYIDRRLGEIRQVDNPHTSEPVRKEVIDYWLRKGITQI